MAKAKTAQNGSALGKLPIITACLVAFYAFCTFMNSINVSAAASVLGERSEASKSELYWGGEQAADRL